MEEEKKIEAVQSKQQNVEVKSVPTSSSPETKPPVTITSSHKKKNKTWIFILIAVILVIAILLVIFMKPNTNRSTVEKYNYSYSVYYGNALADSGSSLFSKGDVAETIGLESNELDKQITNMQVGEEKNITLEAKDAYGTYDPELNFTYSRVEKQPRENSMNKTTWIAINDFTQAFSEQPILNEDYNLSGAPWLYKVVELNSTSVRISQEAQLNQEIPYGEFYYKVIEVTSDKIKLRLFGQDTVISTDNGDYIINFTTNEIITTFAPEVGSVIALTGYPEAEVIGMNATDVFLDANNPAAGKSVTVTIKLNDIKKETVVSSGSKNNGPTFQFFIMSHCPYGTQMAKGVLPVWEKFKDKANIELRFVSYTMHGAKEDLDNNRLICIREEQSSKLRAYLDCFVYGDGSETSSQACIASTGIDKTKLESCIDSRAAGYMEVDKALNEEFGVQGSPTVIINGQEANVYPRDPQSVANALCNAFTSKPSECSFKFDTTNPSPGFGGGSASSSGSGASCG
jgi:FKBP-type peptidyl-prolyl cis-trans isomerase 2